VVDKFLMQLEGQLHEKKVEAIFTDTLREHLAKNGFDPLMGARPMSRLIQDTIRRALADELLFGKLANGGKVTVDIDETERSRSSSSRRKSQRLLPRHRSVAAVGRRRPPRAAFSFVFGVTHRTERLECPGFGVSL